MTVQPSYPSPLIPEFNPDPSCVLVDGTYYLVTSSFEYLPALPVYRSTDFVSWEHLGNVAVRESQVGLGNAPSGGGVWAPTIRHRDGTFYVIVGIVGGTREFVVFTARDPAGPWDDGICIEDIHGIDPDLAWDEDGTAYVTYSGFHLDGGHESPDHRGILQARVDLSTGEALEPPRQLWSGTGLAAPEAPHVVRRGDYWYLVIAEGGAGQGHSVSVARGSSIEGPFAGAPGNPLLSALGSPRPVACTGHADLVEGPDGRDLMVLLGTRSVGSASPLGREAFVTTVEWVDGWPVPAPVALSPRAEPYDEHFDFADDSALSDPGWLAVRRTPRDVTASQDRAGYLSLRGPSGIGEQQPAFIARRQRHLNCIFEARVNATEGRGGLALRYDEDSAITLLAEPGDAPGTMAVTARALLPSVTQSWTTEVPGDDVLLRLQTDGVVRKKAGWSPGGDLIRLLVTDGLGVQTQLVELDGRFWSIEAAQAFTGRVVGMIAEAGIVRFASFSYHGEGST